MRLQSKKIAVFADYHQFYLWDQGTNPQAPEDYTDEDLLRRIKTGPHVIVVLPVRNMVIPVEVEVHDVEPRDLPEGWDHIVEASLYLPTGHLQVHECTGEAVSDFEVTPGWYRVRTYHGGFDTIDDFGTAGEDYYRVVLWPAPPADVVVIKQWVPAEVAQPRSAPERE